MARLWEFLKQAPPNVPKFPYRVLVRLPLYTLTGLFLVFLVAVADKLIDVSAGPGFLIFATGFSLAVVAVGLLQVIAVPYGLWMLLGIDRWTSPQHWLAVVCGAAHFCFSMYYVYTSLLSPKH